MADRFHTSFVHISAEEIHDVISIVQHIQYHACTAAIAAIHISLVNVQLFNTMNWSTQTKAKAVPLGGTTLDILHH